MAKEINGFPDFSKDKKAGRAFADAMAEADRRTWEMAQAAKRAAQAKTKAPAKKSKAPTKKSK